jgi:Na+-transporting methylmalonyl-CoA/oxaloacetate decarboxylase gamma subunit
MNRRLAIATMFLVLALLCLLLVGMSSAMRADGTTAAATLPQPSPVSAPQSAGAAQVVTPQVAGAGTMSGEFADRRLASLGLGRAPWIYVPSERWFRGHPGWRHAGTRPRTGTPASWC